MSPNNHLPQDIAVVGGGLAGAMQALMLAQQGYRVNVYERRPDPRNEDQAQGRSINLGLSKRGMQALNEVGLLSIVMSRAVKMRGRVIHTSDGSTHYQPYGKDEHEVLYSIDRNDLNRLLIDKADKFELLRLNFNHRLKHVNKTKKVLEFVIGDDIVQIRPDWCIGADGAFSVMRKELQRGVRADYQQEYLEWGYKELTLEAGDDGQSLIELNALHVWPRSHCLIVSHPNLDGSHTLTLFLPFKGPDSFETIRSKALAMELFDKYFPDLHPHTADLLRRWEDYPVGSLITTRTSQWHFDDWAVLVGDACHAQYPFYGQGMNSAFEDCSVLLEQLKATPDNPGKAFEFYAECRRPQTDVLAQLSKENFVELRSKVNSPWFMARKKLDSLIHRMFPKTWLPLYSMIAHTTMPYSQALNKARKQEQILNVTLTVLFCVSSLLLFLFL